MFCINGHQTHDLFHSVGGEAVGPQQMLRREEKGALTRKKKGCGRQNSTTSNEHDSRSKGDISISTSTDII